MARDPNKPKKVRKGPRDVKPRQRLNYINIRVGELNAELERLKAERAGLREKMGAERGGRKPAAADDGDDD